MMQPQRPRMLYALLERDTSALGLMARRTLSNWATEGPESTSISGHLSILWIQPGSQEGLRAVQRWR
jgi:hypothetical protein